MTAKKAYQKIFITIILIVFTLIFYGLKVSKLKLGWSFLGFMFCAFFAFLFSFKIFDELEKKQETLNHKNQLYDWLSFLAISLMFIFIIFMFFVLPTTVSQTSMSPTLNNKERVLVYHFKYEPKKGDIVIISMSKESYPRAEGLRGKNAFFVKRIVALSGDKITFKHVAKDYYNIYINDELYKNSVGEIYQIKDYQKINLELDLENNIVPKDKYIVFGDNEQGSQDSRSFGPILKKDIIGKVIYKIWPLGKVD